jgi:hypothetical protein
MLHFTFPSAWSLQMAVPLLTKKIVKKRVKQFKRPHHDRYICLKVKRISLIWNEAYAHGAFLV